MEFEIFEAEDSKMIQHVDFKLDTCRIFGAKKQFKLTPPVHVKKSSLESASPRNSPGDSQPLSFNALGFLSRIEIAGSGPSA